MALLGDLENAVLHKSILEARAEHSRSLLQTCLQSMRAAVRFWVYLGKLVLIVYFCGVNKRAVRAYCRLPQALLPRLLISLDCATANILERWLQFGNCLRAEAVQVLEIILIDCFLRLLLHGTASPSS